MNGLSSLEPDYCEFVEVDPTGRYGRYHEILGKGASKTVYRAFDEYEGIEVAWNQVKLYDFLQSPEDLERLYCEIHLLKTLKHKNIMKFYTSWVDTAKRNINFVTEMFTSGTLRQYRLKHRRVNIRAVKHWCRQILKGLLYLHSHDPPVIHRDLKCDNIFVNGNQGEVKIGDLGLAAILKKSHAAHCVGTPEFMAPEVYEEEYNELVDIYSFGMCILEMVTFEYPYSECNNPAQIYKKVISGKKPGALYKVHDPELRQFIEKCLATVSSRLSARELLNDPFLQIDYYDPDLLSTEYHGDDGVGLLMRQPLLNHHTSNGSVMDGNCSNYDFESYNNWSNHCAEIENCGIDLFEHYEDDEHSPDVDISIKGKRKEDGSIFLRLRIADKEDRIRNIYFPFDIEMDTALSVATEMVAELDMTDQDVTRIAAMIDGEIASLVPGWVSGPPMEETPGFANLQLCQNCASNHTSMGSFMDFLSNNPDAHNLQLLHCSNGCAAMHHGRFGEIMYQVDEGSDHSNVGAPNSSSHCNGDHYVELLDQHDSAEFCSLNSGPTHSDEEHEKLDKHDSAEYEVGNGKAFKNHDESNGRCSAKQLLNSRPFSMVPVSHRASADDNENEAQWELRWLKAKYQLELRDLKSQQLRMMSESSTPRDNEAKHGFILATSPNLFREHERGNLLETPGHLNCEPNNHVEKNNSSSPSSGARRALNREATQDSSLNTQNLMTNKSFCTGSLLPIALHRTTSLPVDAVYM